MQNKESFFEELYLSSALYTLKKRNTLYFHRTVLSERSEDLVFFRSLKRYDFDTALTGFFIFCDLYVYEL